jgi:hypothetical protein
MDGVRHTTVDNDYETHGGMTRTIIPHCFI